MRSAERFIVGVSASFFCSSGGFADEGMSICLPKGLAKEVVRMKKIIRRLAISEKDVKSGLISPSLFLPIRFIRS
jgi:hypothetical protein